MEKEKISHEEHQMAEAIVKNESQKVESFLEHERKQEVAVIDSHSTTPIRVVAIGGNEGYYRTVLAELHKDYPDVEFVKFISAGGSNAFFAIDSLDPDIILIAYDAPIQNAVQLFDTIRNGADSHSGVPYSEKYKDKRVIVLTPNDYQYAMELRSHGVKYMIPMVDARYYSVKTDVLMKIIHEAYNDIQEIKHQRELGFNIPAPNDHPSASPQMNPYSYAKEERAPGYPPAGRHDYNNYGGYYPQQEEQQRPMLPHKIIGIYSGTGGAGTTMFATNLASILSKYSKDEGTDYRVCLVEYNLACRNIDVFFNLKFPKQSKKSITSIAQDAYNLYYDKTAESITAGPREMIPIISRYTEHIPSIGLDVIPGIAVPLEIEQISTGFSTALFTTLRQMYDVVIVDLSADVAKMPMLEAMNEIDDFYYIMPMDVPSIRNAKVLIKFLSGSFKKAPEEIKVIMNKVDPENEMFGVEQVTDILIKKGEEICTPEGTVPYEPNDVAASINQGTPIAMSNPEHPVSQAIFSIALGINPMLNMSILEKEKEEEEAKKSSGFFSRLFNSDKKAKKAEEKPALTNKKAKKLLTAGTSKKATPAPQKPAVDEEDEFIEEEKPKKKGFFARLFGGSKGDKAPKAKKKLTKKR